MGIGRSYDLTLADEVPEAIVGGGIEKAGIGDDLIGEEEEDREEVKRKHSSGRVSLGPLQIYIIYCLCMYVGMYVCR